MGSSSLDLGLRGSWGGRQGAELRGLEQQGFSQGGLAAAAMAYECDVAKPIGLATSHQSLLPLLGSCGADAGALATKPVWRAESGDGSGILSRSLRAFFVDPLLQQVPAEAIGHAGQIVADDAFRTLVGNACSEPLW